MKIYFYEIESWEESFVRQNLPDHEPFFFKNRIDEMDLPSESEAEAISIFVNSRITPEVLERFPNLKFIATRSTGFDHIDIEAAKKRGILVAYVPGYGDNTVAEFAFGLILNLTRKIYRAIDRVKETGSFSLRDLRGADLKGKTIGVVGTGRIGREMVKIAKGFGMEVLAFDIFQNKAFAEEMVFKYVALDELLRNSDIVSLHCPFTEESRHLINKDNVKLFKRGAYLINTARGGIVETEALVRGLKEGILAGAGLDVLEEEGEINNELMKMSNVLITPHNAFNSEEAIRRILATTVQNIRGYLAGKAVNIVG